MHLIYDIPFEYNKDQGFRENCLHEDCEDPRKQPRLLRGSFDTPKKYIQDSREDPHRDLSTNFKR